MIDISISVSVSIYINLYYIDTDNIVVIARGKGVDVLLRCTLEICMVF